MTVHAALDGVRAGVSKAVLADVAEFVLRAGGVRDAVVSIVLVSPRAIARLNREYLGHRGATDVIAFAHAPAGRAATVVADIYVCPAVARENARAYGATAREELLRLVVHGTLHATGWDHPEGAKRVESPMWTEQERLLDAWHGRASRRNRAPRGGRA